MTIGTLLVVELGGVTCLMRDGECRWEDDIRVSLSFDLLYPLLEQFYLLLGGHLGLAELKVPVVLLWLDIPLPIVLDPLSELAIPICLILRYRRVAGVWLISSHTAIIKNGSALFLIINWLPQSFDYLLELLICCLNNLPSLIAHRWRVLALERSSCWSRHCEAIVGSSSELLVEMLCLKLLEGLEDVVLFM